MKKILLGLLILLWIVFGVYLLLPLPTIAPLPNSIKSTEPGDTVQVPNVSGYFSNQSRETVMYFYRQQFTQSTIPGFSFPTYSLEHPPLYAQERIRDQLKAWYFEELVHPFRESFYVAGWTPALAQASLRIKFAPIVVDNKVYYQKTTVRLMPSSVLARMSVYLLMTAALVGTYYVGKLSLRAEV